jgi:hypothetical protein
MWGVPGSVKDVNALFEGYIAGDIQKLPWSEQPLEQESTVIKKNLRLLNRHGFLTINSQPAVNAAPSSDVVHGWGAKRNGFVFQKAYIEFFCSPARMQQLLERIPAHQTLTWQAMNARGDEKTNRKTDKANAVTWGVFPGSEVIQPTVVDPVSFKTWRIEAFELWRYGWAALYDTCDGRYDASDGGEAGEAGEAGEGGAGGGGEEGKEGTERIEGKERKVPREGHVEAKVLLDSIHDSYWLCQIVDNDYVEGNIFSIFKDIIFER